MICPSCGKENPEGSLFCNSCGAKISNEEINNVKINTLQDNKKSNKKSKVIRCIAVIFIIMAISIFSLYLYLLSHIKNNLNISISKAEKYAKENKYNDAALTLDAVHIPDSSILSMYMGGKIIYGKLNNEVESKYKEYTYENYASIISKINHVQEFDDKDNDKDNDVSDTCTGAIMFYFEDLKSKGYNDEVNKLYSVIIDKMKTTLSQDKVFGQGINELLFNMFKDQIGDKNVLEQICKLNQSYLTEDQKNIGLNTHSLSHRIELEKEYKNQPKEPIVGMTADEVRNSTWGNPSHINKTITVNGTSEQWVYGGNRYIYLDNGVVTSIQE